MKTYDLDNPKSAREYLSNVRINGKAITYINTNSRRINFLDCTDEEACDAARMIYEQFHCYQDRVNQGLQS